MLHRVFLPQLGQTMEEGTIEKWHKREGDRVTKGELLFELTTDKATLEVEAMAEGVVKRILVADGQTVPVNELIAVIGDEADEVPEEMLAARQGPAERAATVGAASPAAEQARAEPRVEPSAAAAPPAGFASPRARRAAREQDVPLQALQGTGPGGRIIERDVQTYLEKLKDVRYTPTARAYASEQGVSLLDVAAQVSGRRVSKADVRAAIESGAVGPSGLVEAGKRVALTPMRRTIAERMTKSKQTAPHFYLVGGVMMRAAMEFLPEASAAAGGKITITALLIRAVALALREHPRVNARFDGDAVVLNAACNVGVAVAVEDGLFVPVIKRADAKALKEISGELRSLAEAARAGSLVPEQYEGGSITISNMGMYGVDYFLPIINPPESCIIGIGTISDQAVVEDGDIHAEPVMKISITADHRVIDGAEAAEFFRTLKALLEEPRRLAS